MNLARDDVVYVCLRAAQRFKAERAWFNLNLSKQSIQDLLMRHDWYTLFIPEAALEFRTFGQVREWLEIVTALLKKYAARYYNNEKSAYEQRFLELRELSEDDPNFIGEHRLMIEESAADIASRLAELRR